MQELQLFKKRKTVMAQHAFSWQTTLQEARLLEAKLSDMLTATQRNLCRQQNLTFCSLSTGNCGKNDWMFVYSCSVMAFFQPRLLNKYLRLFLNGEMGVTLEEQRPVLNSLRRLHHAHVFRVCSIVLCPPPCTCPQPSFHTTLHRKLCHLVTKHKDHRVQRESRNNHTWRPSGAIQN